MPIDLISYDYLDTYQPPAGMIRITAVEGWGFSILKKRLINDIPDIYCLISLGGSSPPFRTSTVWDNCNPSWEDDSCDFILYDVDQKIYVKAYDDDPSPMDAGTELGNAEITVRDLFSKRRSSGEEDGGVLTAELELAWNGNPHTGCYIKISAKKFDLSNQLRSLSSPKYDGEHHICGLATIIVTRAFDIPLTEEEAASYVKVQYGNRSSNTFVTSTVPYDLNPRYMNGAFHLPLTADMMVQEDSLGDTAAAAASSVGGPAPRRNHSSLASSISPKSLVGRERTRKSTGRREHTRTKNNLATSMLKTSMSIVESAMHRKDQTPKNKNDIVFKLRNGDSSNTSSHKKLGSFTVTHESLVRARNHTITERRSIGEDGASLEFRVVLSGMPTEDGNALSPRESEMLDLGFSVHDTTKRSIRVTALKGRGFLLKKKNLVLGHRNDIPDVYCYIRLNSSQQQQQQHQQSHGSLCWRTSTIKDDTMPKWNEEKTFTTANSNLDVVRVDAYDEHRTSNDKYIGSAEYSLEKLLRKRMMEMELRNGSKSTGSFVTLKGVQTELATDDDITDELENDEMDDASYDFDEGDVLASGLGLSCTSPHQNECDSINSNILALGLGLSPDECDIIDSDSEDDDGGDFAQSLPAGPTWVQPHSDESVHNRKTLLQAMSLPVNVKDNMKEKLTSQLAKKRHTIEHAKKEAMDMKANLASHLPGHSL
mmetsp:Transcript_11466/g.21719  ORF Transcript_11466/g.21719 Transcript_11466/m.21719 type:complete len:710 (+) Transcript_11466:170-2299(+)|eukprot:CAMPEP_0201685288 /NCGR_PEP_ID=MMETSP0494-20130426/53080_1 /ASSEMBLY_ACC=CAM_ASM_000839 /TAXON_ID=420259 /ORGANISM="Thalassiosira gravida, Strain GMp14c1" /LENGTH=709 /DNA_ID=CAMNT_0048169119 /DNA_START=536 /DNA_END=2665 /DNA_ORIENTATION=-